MEIITYFYYLYLIISIDIEKQAEGISFYLMFRTQN